VGGLIALLCVFGRWRNVVSRTVFNFIIRCPKTLRKIPKKEKARTSTRYLRVFEELPTVKSAKETWRAIRSA
jgi:hypothetical protein